MVALFLLSDCVWCLVFIPFEEIVVAQDDGELSGGVGKVVGVAVEPAGRLGHECATQHRVEEDLGGTVQLGRQCLFRFLHRLLIRWFLRLLAFFKVLSTFLYFFFFFFCCCGGGGRGSKVLGFACELADSRLDQEDPVSQCPVNAKKEANPVPWSAFNEEHIPERLGAVQWSAGEVRDQLLLRQTNDIIVCFCCFVLFELTSSS